MKIKELIPYLVIIVLVILIRTFLITPARVDGDSMKDTLYNGEIVLLNKISLKTEGLERFDIVVVKFEDDLLVKRVIGLPNEKIEYKDNKLYINSKEIKTPINFETTENFEGETKEKYYFLLGDNRDNSKDSRYFGSISIKNIKGKVNFVLFPFSKIGKVE